MQIEFVQETVLDYRTNKKESVSKVIEAENLDKAFAIYFREYVNRNKYCNDVRFYLVDQDMVQAYNYA